MALTFQVLGTPGRDNALFLSIDSGQNVDHLLFDCGEGCLSSLSVSDIQSTDHLLFSHFHMDHISGFDTFFRLTYDRTSKANMIWGPPAASQVMHHRFQGFLWNLYQHLESQWCVNDIHPDHVNCTRYMGNQAFQEATLISTTPFTARIIETPHYSIDAYTMDHQTPSMAYIVREASRINVDTSKLASMGLKPGGWLKQIKDSKIADSTTVEMNETSYTLGELRRELLVETLGQSIAYLTDFLMDAAAQERLIPVLQGCTFMICETQYRAADEELARRNFHMTSVQVAETARRANVQELILFHVSDRYDRAEWAELLNEARAIFPNTRFPDGWSI
jgi:ribonuclease Z